jgi:hypothetical protein
MNTSVAIRAHALSGSDRWRRRRRFLWDGRARDGVPAASHRAFGTGFDEAWHEHTELAAFAMAFNMTLPMVLVMRYRGHSWERGGEMAAAMFLPALPLLVLLWLGLISAHWVLPLQMVLMLPSMIVAMLYRVAEYSHPHPAKAVASRAP